MYGGLNNINGTTCAINTLIQIITHSKRLYDALHSSYTYDANNQEASKLVWHLTFITYALANSNSVTPGGLVSLLYDIFPDNFVRGEQMDIYELWVLIANRITDEIGVNKTCNITHPNNINSDISSKVQENINKINNGKYSAWLENIQSIQLGVLKCLNPSCGDTPWNAEVFNSFEVDIPLNSDPQNPIVIDQLLLKNHVIEEFLEWKCDKCNSKGGIKQSQIYTLPHVLMIMIKRFRMTTNGTFQKINTPINISNNINFQLNGISTNYNLIGIGNHYGVYGGGHYTAHVLENNNWICFDDIHRSVIDISKHNIFVNNNSAYILCYELV